MTTHPITPGERVILIFAGLFYILFGSIVNAFANMTGVGPVYGGYLIILLGLMTIFTSLVGCFPTRRPLLTTALLLAAVVGIRLLFEPLPPTIEWNPKEPPQENRRLAHPLGFSMIQPPDWRPRAIASDLGETYYLSLIHI